MITEREVLELFVKSRQNLKNQTLFNIKIIEYFIQEFENILKNFKDKNHEKRTEDLRRFYLNFEKELSPEDTEPENFLEPDIINLFLYVTEYLNKKEAENLLKNAKKLLAEYKNM